MYVGNIDQQTLRLAIERLEGAIEAVRDMRRRRGEPWSLEFQLKLSVTLQELKGLVLQ